LAFDSILPQIVASPRQYTVVASLGRSTPILPPYEILERGRERPPSTDLPSTSQLSPRTSACSARDTMDQAALQPRKCPGLNCDNDASTLQCPKCKEMGVESFFCSQDCFKRSWVGVLGLRKTGDRPSNAILTPTRLSTRPCTRVRTLCATSSLQVLCLRSIQKPGISIRSQHIPSRAPLGLSILFQRNEMSQNRYRTLNGHKRAYRITRMSRETISPY
jgi:zf-MYND-like zinc finger, mRNA-binding